jgi:hypothetical protein
VLRGRPLIDKFIQPGAAPPSETCHNLPRGAAITLQVAGEPAQARYVDRMSTQAGAAAARAAGQCRFPYTAMAAIEWDRRRKLIVGVDQGLFAAAVATQRTIMASSDHSPKS